MKRLYEDWAFEKEKQLLYEHLQLYSMKENHLIDSTRT